MEDTFIDLFNTPPEKPLRGLRNWKAEIIPNEESGFAIVIPDLKFKHKFQEAAGVHFRLAIDFVSVDEGGCQKIEVTSSTITKYGEVVFDNHFATYKLFGPGCFTRI
jgi:hypothetical protein